MDGSAQARAIVQPVWQRPDFRKLWIGQIVSEIGSRISREGLPMTAVLLLGATPAQMGLLSGMSGFAVLAFGLMAGLWVDRVRRRPVLIAADLARAVLLAWIPIAAAFGWLRFWQLCTVAALAGTATVFFEVAYPSYVPSLLSEGQLLEGNSKLAMSSSMAEILGPSLTGVLVQAISAPRAILLDSLSFVWSAVMIALIRTPEPAPTPAPEGAPFWQEAGAGFVAVWRHPMLRALGGYSATVGLFWGFFGTLYVYYALTVLHLTPTMLGVVIACGGFSALAGASLAQKLPRRFGVGRVLIGSTVLTGVLSWSQPLAHGSPLACALFLAVGQLGDIGWALYFVNELTLRQRITPPEVLGRVNAAMQLLLRGIIPFGSLLGGVLASHYGTRVTLTVSALGLLLSSLWLILSPLRHEREALADQR